MCRSEQQYTCVLDTLFIQYTESTRINELTIFHNRALKEYLNLCNTTNICTCIKTFYHILSFTNMFRLLCNHHQGSFTRILRIQTNLSTYIQVETLNVKINASDSHYNHKMSAYVLL
jgi:hypothetical protein